MSDRSRRSTAPRTSVVVPSYRGADRLPVLLDAFSRQTETDFEIVVVIDGDEDGSAGVVRRAAGDLPVRAVVLPENRGRVAALNAGFEAARGEVLVRCDDDLEPAPDYVAAHAARHTGPPVGVVGIYRDVLGEGTYQRVYGLPREERLRRGAYAGRLATWHYWAGNCSVTRATRELVGPYCAAYTHYGWEDVDYGYRLHQAGIPVVLAPELETVHHGAATSTLSRTLRAYHSGAARRTFEARHDGVLPAPSAGGGWWGSLVTATTCLSGEERFERLARLVDQALPAVPAPVGDKLVSLCVEAASLAGYENAPSVSARF